LGANVTVFDISQENKRYAMELAGEAKVSLNYVVGDFCVADKQEFGGTFDFALAELGILHYFHDLSVLFGTVGAILKAGGTFILSDFHPFRKTLSISQTDGDYFDDRVHEGDVAYQRFFPKEEQAAFPKCSMRLYTMSEIINALIGAGFTIKRFDEHPDWNNAKIPGWYHIQAIK
jgi:2-polyprenyl-3-methyl-5-hydroxy-6-metoxy-1,4-benzoquinol methylase